MKRHIDVVGAVIVKDGNVLCARRGTLGTLAGMWEFPGGKVEPDESPRDALFREIREELECEVGVGDEVATTDHEYDFGIVRLTTFYCQLITGTLRVTEHAELRWCRPEEMTALSWAPADVPAVKRIVEDMSNE
jgi:8-oxo-dGTP diphosphatase